MRTWIGTDRDRDWYGSGSVRYGYGSVLMRFGASEYILGPQWSILTIPAKALTPRIEFLSPIMGGHRLRAPAGAFGLPRPPFFRKKDFSIANNSSRPPPIPCQMSPSGVTGLRRQSLSLDVIVRGVWKCTNLWDAIGLLDESLSQLKRYYAPTAYSSRVRAVLRG